MSPPVIILFAAISTQVSNPDALHMPTLQHLRKFQEFVDSDRPKDEAVMKAIVSLSEQIPDKHLLTVERFALSGDAKSIRWPLVLLLVDRDQVEAAARVAIAALASVKKDRSYAMWKWWEHHFGERDNYKDLSRRFVLELLGQFEKGNEATKLVIAEVFDQGENEARFTVSEFKRAIGFKDK